MTRPVFQLAQLNEADLALDAVRIRLAEIAAALREPAELVAARQAHAAAEAELAHCRTAQRDLELAQADANAKIGRTEQRLYSGQISNPRELENAERDLQQQRNQQAHVEDLLLEAFLAVEMAAEQHAACQATLTQLTTEWTVTQAALREEQARLKARLPGLQTRQIAARQAAPQNLLQLYDNLRARKGGRAVAELDGETCSACHVAVPASKLATAFEGDELTYCGNCGRLLWSE